MNNEQKPDILLEKADRFAWEIYRLTKEFPKSELFITTSQLRRSALSVPLNIIEGFARHSIGYHCRFLEISYGSLKEAKYLLNFALRENYISKEEYKKTTELAEEVARMLWKKIQTLRKKQEN